MSDAHARSSSIAGTPAFDRPYVVSWNLTYRCNLVCEHCYLDAGPDPKVASEAFADRRELPTAECLGIADQIARFAPECLTILTGGEPLLRRDVLDIVRHCAGLGLWVVVGTNGVIITANVARRLREAGARGLSLSLDALDAERHDRFRGVRGAFRNTVEGAAILRDEGLPFIVQTTIGAHNLDEIEAIADYSHDRLGARVWNLYFLVPTGRGQFVSDIEPKQYDEVLATLARLQKRYAGRMLVNAKCAPHHVRTAFAEAADRGEAPSFKEFSGGAGGCPAGTHYFGIRPNGDVTPCPYLPLFGGNLRTEPLEAIWSGSDLFRRIRERGSLGGRCGACELASHCGGCRARAYGATGDLMAEDPLCTHTPGLYAIEVPARPIAAATGGTGAERPHASPPVVQYGVAAEMSLVWEAEAGARMKRIPAFVRGMVVRAVEEACRKEGLDRVTVEALERIRERMPAAGLFGASGPRVDR